MNTKSIIAILLAVVLVVLAVKLLDRRQEPSSRLGSDIENSLNRAGDNIEEGLNDAGRKIEDATD